MLTGSLQSYCTQGAAFSLSQFRCSAYTPWERSKEFSGVWPSFNAEILFSLTRVKLEGMATLAILTARSGDCATDFGPPSAVTTAAPVSDARNWRRLASIWKTFPEGCLTVAFPALCFFIIVLRSCAGYALLILLYPPFGNSRFAPCGWAAL